MTQSEIQFSMADISLMDAVESDGDSDYGIKKLPKIKRMLTVVPEQEINEVISEDSEEHDG